MKGTSSVPMIMGIIGSVLMLPALGCSLFCGAVFEESGATGSMALMVVFGLLPLVLGIVGGVKGKSDPNISFICLLVAAISAFVSFVLSAFTNFVIIPAVVLYIIGAVIAKTQKMEF
jgi:hypothetical protein